jgi:hypothetical protein
MNDSAVGRYVRQGIYSHGLSEILPGRLFQGTIRCDASLRTVDQLDIARSSKCERVRLQRKYPVCLLL